MASTEFASGSDHAVVRWSQQLTRETLDQMFIKRFLGTKKTSIIRFHRDLVTAPGDTIHVPLLVLNRTAPRVGDQELSGYEESLTYYDDTLKIEQGRKAHEARGMSQQRVNYNLTEDARENLAMYWAGVFDSLMFAYLSGYTGTVAQNPECVLNYVTASGWGGNSFRTPDAAHVYDPTSTSTLAHYNMAKEKAKVANPRVEPTVINGKPYYCVVVHPRTMRTLRNLYSASAVNVNTIYQEIGPRAMSNPLLTGAEFVYNGMIFYESEYIPCATGPLVYNLLLGSGAGHFAVGNAWGNHTSEPAMFKRTYEERDHGNIKSVGSTVIFGIQAAQWNSARHGCIVVVGDDAAA